MWINNQTNIWPLDYSSQSQIGQRLLPPLVTKVGSSNSVVGSSFPAGPVWDKYVWSQNTRGSLLSPCSTQINLPPDLCSWFMATFIPLGKFIPVIPKEYHPLTYRSSSSYWVETSLTKPETNSLTPNYKSTAACIYLVIFSCIQQICTDPELYTKHCCRCWGHSNEQSTPKKSLASWSSPSTKGDS